MCSLRSSRHGRPARQALEGGATPAADPAQPEAAADARAGTVAYYEFDLLHYDEWDLRGLPLVERKQLLRSLLPPLPALLYADHVTASGESLAAVAAGAGFHGLLAKRAASTYRPGAQSDWRRVPLQASAGAREVEVGAATSPPPPAGSASRRTSGSRNLDKVFWPEEMLQIKGRPAGVLRNRSPTSSCPTCSRPARCT